MLSVLFIQPLVVDRPRLTPRRASVKRPYNGWALDAKFARSGRRQTETGDSDVSEDQRTCAEDHVAIRVEKVVSADGAMQYVGTLTVDDGLPLELVLFRRVVAVSSGHT